MTSVLSRHRCTCFKNGEDGEGGGGGKQCSAGNGVRAQIVEGTARVAKYLDSAQLVSSCRTHVSGLKLARGVLPLELNVQTTQWSPHGLKPGNRSMRRDLTDCPPPSVCRLRNDYQKFITVNQSTRYAMYN